MASIEIVRAHTLGVDGARSKAEALAKEMASKMAMVGIKGPFWNSDRTEAQLVGDSGSAKGTKGVINFTADQIKIKVDLPLMLSPFKGMVESTVNNKLNELIPAG